MSKYEFIPISEPLDVGTRIHWDESTQSIYFVDLPKSTVYKYEINTGTTTKAKVGNEPLTCMFPVEGSNTKFVAGISRKFALVEWDGKSPQVAKIETIAEVETEPDVRGNRLNGAKIDPWGRLWAGTMGPEDTNGEVIPERGALYSLDKGTVTKHKSNIGISNGLAWDTNKMKMYYCDTLQPKIFQYDYSEDGKISNEKVIFEYGDKIEGKPDGLAIDKNGDLWLCSIFGSVLCKIDPSNGNIKEKIVMPTSQPTAVTFGGKNLDEMFVVTARIPVNGKIPPHPAGVTYWIKNIGTPGFVKDTRYKL